ncbi:MAG: sigma-70 family RNA polymerase sigma factor [Pyrinomonadaceae bacterium]|jgi:RNA polymerase sigma-70 factor (ECF subfamily)|nr:sigma-70 family RNA polymerase sigma factor [Pyrinomonadaceae bacterium]
MTALAEKNKSILQESVARLLARTQNARGLQIEDLQPRIEKSLNKYLPNASNTDIKEFIDSLNADDLCLIAACERGDESAWEDLVKNFDTTVKSAARSISKNADDAEDLANSIWAELHGLRKDADGNLRRKISYYSGRGSLGGWLRAVVNQLAIDEFRKQSKFVQIEETREFENLANENEDGLVIPTHETPEQIFSEKQSQKDVSESLKEAIATLEAEDKLLIKLYYFDNLNLKMIGATLGFHEATASRKLVRVQNDLRKSTEKILQTKFGWKENEVKNHLAETAEKLGFSVEKLFSILIIFCIMQELFY